MWRSAWSNIHIGASQKLADHGGDVRRRDACLFSTIALIDQLPNVRPFGNCVFWTSTSMPAASRRRDEAGLSRAKKVHGILRSLGCLAGGDAHRKKIQGGNDATHGSFVTYRSDMSSCLVAVRKKL